MKSAVAALLLAPVVTASVFSNSSVAANRYAFESFKADFGRT